MTEQETIKQNRKFGYTIAVAFLVLASFRIFVRHQNGWYVLFAAAIVILLLALIKPVWLNPLRLVWDKIGHVLGVINTCILLTAFYFFILTPLGLVMRLFGKDIIKLKRLGKQPTYWETVSPKTESSMENQF